MTGTTSTPANGSPRCSELAEAAGDPMEGSAPPAEQWFIVEHPRPWHPYTFGDPRFDRAAVLTVERWSRAEHARVLLIRRPGRRTDPTGRWFRVDSRPGRESIRTGVLEQVDALPGVLANPRAGELVDGPLYLVCTHGRHDTCCAIRGRPLAAALEAAEPERVWETSHVGACRFAAAMVLLPHGVVLGGVSAADGPGVAAAYASGLLPTSGVRGRTSLPPAVQAAQHHARIATGEYGVDALAPVAVHDTDGTWRVTFTDPDVTVAVREQRVPVDRPLTCAATRPGWLRSFDLVDVAPS